MGIYNFETGKNRRAFYNEKLENDALDEFAERLKFGKSNFREHRELLLNFILNYHKLIDRYDVLICWEETKRNWCIAGSLLLLFLIPILLYVAPDVLERTLNISNKSDSLAQIAALLTGLLTIQKALSTWLDKRKIIGSFRKARSDLKTKLYTFEDKWTGQATETIEENGTETEKLKNDFLQEARIAIREAQKIVEEEQSQYFEAITSQSIDIGTILAEARKSAVSNVGDLIPSQSENKKQALLEKKKAVLVLESEISLRKNLIEQKKSNITDENRAGFEAEITAHAKKILDREDELIKAKSELEALLRMQSI
jgi:hypothetical protein